MSKHSAGPWRVALSNFKLGPQGGHDILNQHGPIARKVFWEDDAHLTAAAPNMLKALKDLVQTHEACRRLKGLPKSSPVTDAARAAIATAEGRDGK